MSRLPAPVHKIPDFSSVLVPVLRNFPTSTINDIVSVQPMTKAKGSVFSMAVYEPTEADRRRDDLLRTVLRRLRIDAIEGISLKIPGQVWEIARQEYRDLGYGDMKFRDALCRYPNARVFYYDDIRCLSGRSGVCLLEHFPGEGWKPVAWETWTVS